MYDKNMFDFIDVSKIPEEVFNQTLMPFREQSTDRCALQYIDYLFLLEAYQQRMGPFKNQSNKIVVSDVYKSLNTNFFNGIMLQDNGGEPSTFGMVGPMLFGNKSAYCNNSIQLTSRTLPSSSARNIELLFFSPPITSSVRLYCKNWIQSPYNKYLVEQFPMCMYTDIMKTTRIGVMLPANQLFNDITLKYYSNVDNSTSYTYPNLNNKNGYVGEFWQFRYAWSSGEYKTTGIDYQVNQKTELNTGLNYTSNIATIICRVNVTYSTTSGTEWYSAYICMPCGCTDGIITLPTSILDTLRQQSLALKNYTIGDSSTHRNCILELTQIMLVLDMSFKASVSFNWQPTYPS